MFFKTLKKQINDLTEEVESLKQDQKNLFERIEDLKKENQKIQRILQNHSHSEITGYFYTGYKVAYPIGWATPGLYVYKDGKEYSFNWLCIENPIFTQGETEDTVYVESGDKGSKYILDLKNGTSILVSKESNEET